MASLISKLKSDILFHENIEQCVSDEQITLAEIALGIKLPNSYKYFLKEFGNGAAALYHIDQPINGIDKKYGKIHRLGEYRPYLSIQIESDGFGTFDTKSLLCLMSENSNGGAWCWLTTENNNSGEWSLAYYNDDKKLYYRISNFMEWLGIASSCKGEVIRELDKNDSLGLG